jgi:hypothetical protein
MKRSTTDRTREHLTQEEGETHVTTTTITTIDPADRTVDFRILHEDLETLRELLRDPIRLCDLDEVKAPAGGALEFSITTPDGDRAVSTLQGAILHRQTHRVRWPETRRRGERPLCKSPDGILGVGDPGGRCGVCPKRLFHDQQKPECQERLYVFFLAPGDFLPSVINLARGSFPPILAYLNGLKKGGLLPSSVVTEFFLVRETNRQGDVYSQVRARRVGMLTPKQKVAMRERLGLFTFAADASDESTSTVHGDEFATAPDLDAPPDDDEAPPPTDEDLPF